jgi:HPt (histidine-containing phosphotransfer) domain-containing protein
MSADEVLDPAVLDTLRQLTVPGEEDVLAQVLTLFLAEVPPRVQRLTEACRAGDAVAMQRAAHSLKGSSGNIGARALYDVCRQIDERGKAGDVAGAVPLLERLAAECARVETAITGILQAS